MCFEVGLDDKSKWNCFLEQLLVYFYNLLHWSSLAYNKSFFNTTTFRNDNFNVIEMFLYNRFSITSEELCLIKRETSKESWRSLVYTQIVLLNSEQSKGHWPNYVNNPYNYVQKHS